MRVHCSVFQIHLFVQCVCKNTFMWKLMYWHGYLIGVSKQSPNHGNQGFHYAVHNISYCNTFHSPFPFLNMSLYKPASTPILDLISKPLWILEIIQMIYIYPCSQATPLPLLMFHHTKHQIQRIEMRLEDTHILNLHTKVWYHVKVCTNMRWSYFLHRR